MPSVPSVVERAELLEAVAGDDWWVDVTPPMLELARLRIRGLVRLVKRTQRNPVYTDFTDELGAATEIALPGATPGINLTRFRAKAAACLGRHADHVALQRLRRNRQLAATAAIALCLSCLLTLGQQAARRSTISGEGQQACAAVRASTRENHPKHPGGMKDRAW